MLQGAESDPPKPLWGGGPVIAQNLGVHPHSRARLITRQSSPGSRLHLAMGSINNFTTYELAPRPRDKVWATGFRERGLWDRTKRGGGRGSAIHAVHRDV
jgi:hypothetical protein